MLVGFGGGKLGSIHASVSFGWVSDEIYHREQWQDSGACCVIHAIPIEAGLAKRGTQPETQNPLLEVQERIPKIFLLWAGLRKRQTVLLPSQMNFLFPKVSSSRLPFPIWKHPRSSTRRLLAFLRGTGRLWARAHTSGSLPLGGVYP